MKKLKFMLASAVAVGFVAATQAATATFNGTTGFEEWAAGDDAIVATGLNDTGSYAPGSSYWQFSGSDASDNESTIKTESQPYSGDKPGSFATHTKLLNVNTGKDPLLRNLEVGGGNQTVGNDGIYIDTLVQFTVTPANETVTVSSANDKLLIYLKEFVIDGALPDTTTNLCVLAGYLDVDTASAVTAKEYILDTGSIDVEPGTWYRLTVKALKDIKGVNGETGCYPGFQIYLNAANNSQANVSCTIANSDPIADASGLEELLQGASAEAELALSEGRYLLSLCAGLGGASATIAAVGFSGEGKVDDLALGTGDPFYVAPSSVDFTFYLQTGVSAVSWTIDGVAQSENHGSVTNGSLIVVTGITYDQANWYGPAGEVSNGWTHVVNESPLLGFGRQIDAAVINPADIPSTATASDLGITGGAFASSDVAELKQVVTWAEANNKTTADVNAMTFADPLSPTLAEKSYLLAEGTSAAITEATAVDALEIASFTYDPVFGWVVICEGLTGGSPLGEGDSLGYGHVDVFGATAVDGTYTSDKTGKSFFKAVLVK